MAAAASFIVLAIVGVSGTKGLIKNSTFSASDIARAESADIAASSEDSGILTAEAGSAESIIIDDSTEKSSAKEISEGSKAEENGTAAQKTEDKAVLTPKAEVPKEKNVQKPKIEENKANEPQKSVSQLSICFLSSFSSLWLKSPSKCLLIYSSVSKQVILCLLLS